MTRDIVFLNDKFMEKDQAQISVMDRGFLFGDGVYEVVPVYNGKLFLLAEHIKRLNYSLEQIQLQLDWNAEQWQTMMEALIVKNGGGNMGLYLQITRGAADTRIHRFPDKVQPTIFAMVWALPPPVEIEDIHPCKVVTTEDIRWQRCDIKCTSLLGNVLLSQIAGDAKADEAFVVKDGIVTEGASSNLFIIKEGQVITSARDNRILGGITRQMVIDLIARLGDEVIEKDLTRDDILEADEVWLTSSTKEIRPVIEVDGIMVSDGKPGPVWKKTVRQFIKDKKALFTQ